MKAQRLRFRYRLSPEARALGHRDVVQAWEEAAKAAGLQVAHSQGKRQAPQISLGAPLPQGATSDWELIDVFLAEAVAPAEALRGIASQLPAGIEATGVREVGVGGPSLQSALRWAEYEVDVPADGLSADDVRAAVERMLGAASVPAEYRREAKVRAYDLRPLVLDLRLDGACEGGYRLRMRLRAEQDNTARADQVVLALGLPAPVRVHRVRLETDEAPAAVQAFRRAFEREDR